MSLTQMLIGFVIAEVVIAVLVAPHICLALPQKLWATLLRRLVRVRDWL